MQKSTSFFLSVSIIFLSAFQLNAQSLIDSNAVWHYSGPNGGTVPPNSEYYRYWVEKDTIYQGQQAKKIERMHFRYAGDSVSWKPLYLFDRNDSVFYYNDHYQRYILLYDFTANVGDTLRFYVPDTAAVQALNLPDSTFRIVVDSIRMQAHGNLMLRGVYSTQLDGMGYNKRSSSSKLSYVEKVGSLDQMLPQYEVAIPEHDGPLRCYEDSSIYIKYTNLSDCDYRIISSLEENTTMSSLFTISPNPVSDFAQLEVANVSIQSIELLDIKGRLVKEFHLNDRRLDFQSVSNGVYFLKVLTLDNESMSKKLIIQ
jgi:hypothetical protein